MPTPEPHVSDSVAAANRALELTLPLTDREDFADARRGFVGELSPAVVSATDGRIVWSLEEYGFLAGDRPESANPSLWRHAQLLAFHGLFEVADGIYQVRGLDLSNMTLVEGEEGVIVIDPLISVETAAAALALYREHRGDRPVTAVIYTHPHIDHFGGARGVVDAADVESGRVPVVAPEGFLEHAVSENVYAGTAMARRASYMFGALLEKGAAGQLTAAIGMTTSLGAISLIPPTLEIVRTGEELTLDGVEILFQLAPESEAPVEMNFLFPRRRALCIAENATHNMHNILTPRGAPVRDARAWAHYLDEAIDLFGDEADVLFAGHHWPRWGRDRIVGFLAKQRDMYAYLHDQTLRLLNKGHVASEIAELVELPPTIEREWHCRGYYGSVNHNVKAIYQRYLGWFDGNPAHLWPHPPVEAAKRYVDFMGGANAVVEKARAAYEAGDFRWVAEVVNHVVFADPDHVAGRELQAAALEQLGYGAENATWRNFFLTGAHELRHGVAGTATTTSAPADIVASLSSEQLFESMAIRLDGTRAFDVRLALNWIFPDVDERFTLTLENAVLRHRRGLREGADATITLDRALLDRIVTGRAELQAGGIEIEGDGAKLGELLSLFDPPDPNFAIVTP